MATTEPIYVMTPPSTPPSVSLPAFLTQPQSTIYNKFSQILEYKKVIGSRPDSIICDPVAFRRDRWGNVRPYNHNRVVLREVQDLEHSYLNASPIDLGRKDETFIATDGPLSDGIERFWRMVWQEGCREIVMLTQPREEDALKCDIYYPQSVGQVIQMESTLTVECLSLVKESGTEVRKMKIVKEEEEMIIWHFLYQNWADLTAPQKKDQKEILDLIKMTRYRLDNREERKKGCGPRLVHCSAGVGRTGTFIALDHLIQDVEKWKDGSLLADDPVFETVKRLREQRMKMVYTKEQYAAIYQFLGEQWET